MTTFIANIILCLWISYCCAQNRYSAEENNNYVHIIHTIDHGGEKFPITVDIAFDHGADRHVFLLARDDVTTDLLSESVFAVSRTLPSDVYRDEDRENFAAYSIENDEANFVLHRETNTSPVKVYGGFTKNGERMVLQAVHGQTDIHRVMREADSHSRPKRGANSEDDRVNYAVNSTDRVIELFLFADLSVFNHFVDNGLATGTMNDKKLAVRDYLRAVVRDVDMIFKAEGSPGFRVYFMEYQIITQTSHQQAFGSGVIDFATYYDKLVTKFAFPDPDHLMMLSSHDIQLCISLSLDCDVQECLQFATQVLRRWGAGVINHMCSGNGRSASIVAYADDEVRYMAQVLAYLLGVNLDGYNACSASDGHVMSYSDVTEAAVRGNAWRFSNCSSTELRAIAAGSGFSCLRQSSVDIYFNFAGFTAYSYVGESYNADEQCAIYHGSNYTFNSTAADCYSATELCVDSSGSGGADQFIRLGHRTPCGYAADVCILGFCETAIATTTPFPTNGGDITGLPISLAPTGSPDCVEKLGFVEFRLPGCGCCGVCGCDDTCDMCPDPVPSESYVNDTCMPQTDCCPGKLLVTTRLIPDGCPVHVKPGPQTIVIDQRGWDDIDVYAVAMVQPNEGGYSVHLKEAH